MSIIQAIVLGLLQGITEFLPVSSSGHLVLVPWLLGWPSPSLAFDVLVHVGTLCAVVACLWREILELVRDWIASVLRRRIDTVGARLAWLVIVSAIPGGLLGFLFEDAFESLFGSPRIVSLLLIVTGLALVIADRLGRRVRQVGDIGLADALILGLAQALAIAPGISRSGATISAGLLRGLKREDAARFSFLMSIPIIAGAALAQLWGLRDEGAGAGGPVQWFLGFAAAAGSGYVAASFLLRYLRSYNLRPFAYYCWAVGLVGFVLTILR